MSDEGNDDLDVTDPLWLTGCSSLVGCGLLPAIGVILFALGLIWYLTSLTGSGLTLTGPKGEIAPGVVLFNGKGEAASSVELLLNDQPVQTVTTDANGEWSVTTNLSQLGDYTALARSGDKKSPALRFSVVEGGAHSSAFTALPVLGALAAAPEGKSSVAYTWTGTADHDAKIDLFAGDLALGQAVADHDGNWTFAGNTNLAPGDYDFYAKMLDGEGHVKAESLKTRLNIPNMNASLPGTGTAITVGALPVLGAWAMSPSGFSMSDFTWGGKAQPNTDIQILANDALVGKTTADANGDWNFAGKIDLPAGKYNLFARMLDKDGNTLGDTIPTVLDIPAVDPGAAPTVVMTATTASAEATSTVTPTEATPVVTATATTTATTETTKTIAALSVIDSPLVANPVLSDTGDVQFALSWVGTGEPGATIDLSLDGSSVATTTVKPDGTWAVTAELSSPAAVYPVVAKMVSADGTSELGQSEPMMITIPQVEAVSPQVAFTADPILGATSAAENGDTKFAFSWAGTGEPGSTIEVVIDGTSVATTTVKPDGTWEVTGEATRPAGEYTFVAGMSSADGTLLDESDPATLVVPAVEATDIISETVAFVAAPTVGELSSAESGDTTIPFSWSGTGEPGGTIDILVDGTSVATTTVQADGTWSYAGETIRPAGEYTLSAQALDGEGNVVGEEVTTTVTVPVAEAATPETSQPVTVTINSITGGEQTYQTVVISGTAAPSSTVELSIDGIVIGTVSADANGQFGYNGYFPGGAHNAKARQLAADGTEVGTSAETPFTVGVVNQPVTPQDSNNGSIRFLFTAPEGQATPTAENGQTGAVDLLAGSPAVELIVDASWSMTFPLDSSNEADRLTSADPNSRIAIAKAALDNLVNEALPEGLPIALRAFGNIEGNLSCRTDLMSPLAPLDRAALDQLVNGITPQFNANTAIANSLAQVATDLSGTDRPKIVVLLTDGQETCGGDPAAEIQKLVAQGIDVQLNIVGFAIADEALRAQFQEWAKLGNGSYYDAQNAEQLTTSLDQAFAVSYNVLDQAGNVVSRGTVGGTPVELAPGNYTVALNSAAGVSYQNVVVTAGGTVELVGR